MRIKQLGFDVDKESVIVDVKNTNDTCSDLNSLELSLTPLVENHQLLKLENEQLEQKYYNLKHSNEALLAKQQKIEQRVRALLERLVALDI